MSCVRKARLPTYTEKRGWKGGDRRALFAFTDKRTGSLTVVPQDFTRGIGPEATVRLATDAEAKTHWQEKLHPGWKVACPKGTK